MVDRYTRISADAWKATVPLDSLDCARRLVLAQTRDLRRELSAEAMLLIPGFSGGQTVCVLFVLSVADRVFITRNSMGYSQSEKPDSGHVYFKL